MEDNRLATMEDNSLATTGALYSVANYVSGSVVTAFFASLERFSCINLTTSDLDDDDDANDRPLMFCNSARHDDPRFTLPAIAALPAPPSPCPADSLPV